MPRMNASPDRKPGPKQRPMEKPVRWAFKEIEERAVHAAKQMALREGVPVAAFVEALILEEHRRFRGETLPAPSEEYLTREATEMALECGQTLPEYISLALQNQIRRDKIRQQQTVQ